MRYIPCHRLGTWNAQDKSAARKRVGFTNKGPPARQHDKIFNMEGKQIGEITSGKELRPKSNKMRLLHSVHVM